MANEEEEEALRLKVAAEAKFTNSNLKSALKYAMKAQQLYPSLQGISVMVHSFKILRIAAKAPPGSSPDWYKILQVEPFAHINSIKSQYKKLALILHPDKNPYVGSEEAFKLVGEAFRFLSDKVRRKEYDVKLRIRIQAEAIGGLVVVETFWTACSRCRLLHKFERKYLGHNLMCPNCNRSFKAVEAEGNDVDCEVNGVRVSKRKATTLEKVDDSSNKVGKTGTVGMENGMGVGEWSRGRLRSRDMQRRMSAVAEVPVRRRMSKVGDILERSRTNRVKNRVETMTLAEMQLEAKRKAKQEKEKMNQNKRKEEGPKVKKSRDLQTEMPGAMKKCGYFVYQTRRASRMSVDDENEIGGLSKSEDSDIMAVEDSDFYDFDKDRMEGSFKKGQVWAIYDDDDGMPRHYGLIDEVLSVNPFQVRMNWLDIQSNGDEKLICWEKMGFHVSCGRFKVGKATSIISVNIFSHFMECERAAREIYLIYPKKGSVWALYNEGALDAEGRNTVVGDKRHYDIVVFLTTYSEIHGLSMAYLEKIHGFKTIFKRREIGCHAIRWLEKDDVRLFSHQIPARKLSGDEVADLPKDCWELDPASLPSDLLTIGWW